MVGIVLSALILFLNQIRTKIEITFLQICQTHNHVLSLLYRNKNQSCLICQTNLSPSALFLYESQIDKHLPEIKLRGLANNLIQTITFFHPQPGDDSEAKVKEQFPSRNSFSLWSPIHTGLDLKNYALSEFGIKGPRQKDTTIMNQWGSNYLCYSDGDFLP